MKSKKNMKYLFGFLFLYLFMFTHNCLEFININASRISNPNRVKDISNFITLFNASIICIQEINIFSALKEFKNGYQVFSNYDLEGNDNVGIVTLIRKEIKVIDQIISNDGRILGIKCNQFQVWNVYPISGTAFKNKRELFFREELANLMMNWKDHSKIFQLGDHNCIHRREDSLNNAAQHLQPGLIAHMKIHGLKDGFIEFHGPNKIEYSRITDRSKTRIDYIFSNSNKCTFFEYVDMGLGLDHKAVHGRYDIDLEGNFEKIPKNRFHPMWVIPKFLEEDEIFIQEVNVLFGDIYSAYIQSGETDISFYWQQSKLFIQKLAKKREKSLKLEEQNRMDILKVYYAGLLTFLNEGSDCLQDIKKIKDEIVQIQKNRSKKLIDKMRGCEIEDHVYDIHKLQKERKYENNKKINEIKIGEVIFSGTEQVVGGIKNKMREELKPFENLSREDPPTLKELTFLNMIPYTDWTKEEVDILTGPIKEEEIFNILKYEVDLDSSPGEDGITYRFIKKFWNFKSYRALYVTFLNSTRDEGHLGEVSNIGTMIVKNKKNQSIEYEKKRKLTKVNKDINLGHGKVWTNRMKDIVLPKILPKTQFNCQKDINIIDEIREIRQVNQFLLGEGNNKQNDGTILSIDFMNAYRSTSLRWFNLVLNTFRLPKEFIDWFWMMYNDLGVVVVINKYKSDVLKVERGFMEGHPPSMAAFVVSIIPLMIALDGKLTGLRTNGKNHKLKGFADDLKLFLKDLNEIEVSYNIINDFEKISGLKMHRDPKREKCQALPFGKHREYKNWPEWITVKNEIKVVGIHFSNIEGNYELLNSKLVAQNFYNGLQCWLGTRGTIFQKVYIVNTFLFSKLWYTAQVVKLDEKILESLLKKAKQFIYGGENEMPVSAINFREVKKGGLGLIHPVFKARALLMKTTYKDFEEGNFTEVGKLYGYSKEFKELVLEGFNMTIVKNTYNKLLEKILFKNGSLIPSRNEKRTDGVKWSLTWKNFHLARNFNAEEKIFFWKVFQDMLPVGRRIHIANVEKRCLYQLSNGNCQVIPDMYHALKDCEGVKEAFKKIHQTTEIFLDRNIKEIMLIFCAFTHKKKNKLKVAVWFVIKSLYLIHIKKMLNKTQLIAEMYKALEWNLKLLKVIGCLDEMKRLLNLME